MSLTTNTVLDQKEIKQWHFNHCEIESETYRDGDIIYFCTEHLVNVTDCVPDFEPDPYDNSQENLNDN